MSDHSEIYPCLKAESQQRRQNNRENSAAILEKNGIRFESKNKDAHLIVSGASVTVDFWPGTGKFIVRGTGKTGRGVFNLLKLEGIKP